MTRLVDTLLTLTLALASVTTSSWALEDAAFWMRAGQARVIRALRVQPNYEQARNVIVFIGDGMGINTITAARIRQGQRHGETGEERELSFDKFPFVGLTKTYNVDKQVPDSAATATAILTGVKVNYNMVGLDATAKLKHCDANDTRRRLPGVVTWAQRAGKATGVVTTTRVTHATPASAYAHTNFRDWECDGEIPIEQRACVKDIARQLVEDAPGDKLNVILGGGWKQMGVVKKQDDEDSCVRSDGRNLVDEWLRAKKGKRALYVDNVDSLMSADLTKVDHLMGLFSPSHMPYVPERSPKQPSLTNMTLQAIKLLQKNKQGYFLLVEAGRIDTAHHDNMARLALGEACELDETVDAVMDAVDLHDTLVVVTADHSHAMTMNGYPERGADILGFANKSPSEKPYETITYANGPGYSTHRVNGSALSGTSDTWVPVETMNRTSPRYMHLAAMYRDTDTHAGEDVPVYSAGPFAHLLTGVFEQNYIGHAIAYAACIGPSEELCKSTNALTRTLPQCEQSLSVANRGHSMTDLGLAIVIWVLWLGFCLF